MKTFILAFIAFFASSFCYAQEYTTDVVYLKNGSIVRGLIIEQVPNQSLKIKTSDGSLFVFNLSEIEKMTKEQPVTVTNTNATTATTNSVNKDYKQNPIWNHNLKHQRHSFKGYKGTIDFSHTFADNDESRIELSTSHGYQFNNHIFLGGGVGYHVYNEYDLYTIPIFVDFRAYFIDKPITPFCDIKAGYSVGDLEGTYGYIGMGVRFCGKDSRKAALVLSAGYSYQEYIFEYGNYQEETINTGGFNLRLGVEF